VTATIYGYVRVSSDQQADSGLSLSAQSERIREAAKRLAKQHGLSIGKVFRDPAVSASRFAFLARDGGCELNRALRKGDHVVIAKLDRAFRSQRDCVLTCEAWMSRGVIVHMLDIGVDTDTPLGRMLIGILSTIAQWEAARIGERIRDANQSRRSQGRSTNGQRIHGYKICRGKLVPDKVERSIAKRMVAMREKGKFLREIAEHFNRLRIRRPSGKPWNPQAVNRMIVRHKNGWPIFLGKTTPPQK
jgi:site-specific DNA recombinase